MTILTQEPETIDKITDGVYLGLAMLAGMQLDLFTPLGNGPMSVQQVADSIGVGPAKLEPLLYALAAACLLTVEGRRFSNTPEADCFLVRGAPAHVGERHETLAERWSIIFKTAESIRAGTAQSKLDFYNISQETVDACSRSRHQQTIAAGRDLVARYDFSRHRHLLDVAGRTGGVTFAVLEAHPHMRGTIVDLPGTTPTTRRYVDESAVADRVKVVSADVVTGPLEGSFDVAVLKSFIQVLAPDEARRALVNVGRVIEPGGTIYIHGSVLDDSRVSPIEAVASNLHFLNIYDGGRSYTEGEYKDWLAEAGFEGFERVIIPSGSSIITARKPAKGPYTVADQANPA